MDELNWKDAYKNAVLESDDSALPFRIEVARRAIHNRLREHIDPLSKREFDDMEGALRTLDLLLKHAA